MATIEMRSSAFSDHALIPARFARDHEDVSPPLSWDAVPDETVELAISCLDPDAPNGTWVHWLVAGLDPSVRSLDEGELPPGAIQGRNDYGEGGYGGPQPPIGDPTHRYFFRVHALREPSKLHEGFSSADFDSAVEASGIATGVVVGTYAR